MSLNCEIKFDNNQTAVYFAGQVISGVCELTLDRPKKVRALRLKIEGYAECNWNESESYRSNGKSHTRTVHYQGREDYVNSLTNLIGSSDGNQIEIPAGLHSYNFTCFLPPLLPTSFEGKYGHIRYTATLTIDRPWKFDINHKVGFTVLKQTDLNFEGAHLQIPSKMEIVKLFCCGLFSKPLYMSASIPVSGYVSGQSINVSVDINNQSSVSVQDVRCSLKKIINYTSKTPKTKTREEIINMAEVRGQGVKEKERASFELKLAIPPVPPTNTQYSRVVNVTYVLQVKAHTSGMHRDLHIRIPIVIGTIPLTCTIPAPSNGYPMHPPTAPSDQMPSAPAAYMAIDQTNMIDLPPPSYEEIARGDGGVHVNHDDHHNMGKQMFNPRYPSYDFGNSIAAATAQNLAGTSEDAPSYGWAQSQPDANFPENK